MCITSAYCVSVSKIILTCISFEPSVSLRNGLKKPSIITCPFQLEKWKLSVWMAYRRLATVNKGKKLGLESRFLNTGLSSFYHIMLSQKESLGYRLSG